MRDSVLRDGMLYAFQQVHRGYPVSNGGYLVDVVNGYVRGGAGKVMIGLPDQLPTPSCSNTLWRSRSSRWSPKEPGPG